MATKPPVKGTAKALSFQEWKKQRGTGPWKGNTDYKVYMDFWNAHHKGIVPQAQAPATGSYGYAPATYQQALQQANALFPRGSMTQEDYMTSAKESVQASIDPIIAEITRSINARSKSGSAAINAATGTYADRMAGIAPQVQGDFDQAKKEQQALDQALTGLAQGQGQAAYGDLAGALGQAGAPEAALQASAGQLQGLGQGAAQQMGGSGAATLSRLISQGAGAEAYAQEMPGFARQQGLAGLQGFQGMLNTMLGEQVGQVKAQIPGMVQSAYTTERTLGDQYAAQRASYISDALSRAATYAIGKMGIDQAYAGMNATTGTNFADIFNQPPPTGSTTDKTGFTPQQKATARASALAEMGAAIGGIGVGGVNQWQTPQFPNTPAGRKQAKQVAGSLYQYWRTRAVNYLNANLGSVFNHAQIVAMADQYLRSQGVHPHQAAVKPKDTTGSEGGKAGGKVEGTTATNNAAVGTVSGASNPKPAWAEGPKGPSGWKRGYIWNPRVGYVRKP